MSEDNIDDLLFRAKATLSSLNGALRAIDLLSEAMGVMPDDLAEVLKTIG